MARVAVVTGGSRGIGAAIAKAMKDAGYSVAANYAGNESAAEAFKGETGIPVFKWDVSDYGSCRGGLERVEKELGPVEVLVNNAGITRDGMFHKMTPDQWYGVINTNLNSLFNMCRPVIEACASATSGASSIFHRSTARRGSGARPTIRPPRPATSDLPRRCPGECQQGHHRERHLPRLYRDGDGPRDPQGRARQAN